MVWRISSRAVFEALRRRARRARCGPVSVAFMKADGLPVPSVGYAVGRRVGNAVARNRIRRRLRAVVSELAGELRPGAYLVSVNPEAPGLSYEELKTKVARAMASASRQSDR